MAGPARGGPLLDGIRVLDLSIWRPGPYATQLLAGQPITALLAP